MHMKKISRTLNSFKDSEYAVWVQSLPQHLAGTGNNSVKRRLFHTELILCNFSPLIKWF